MKVSVCITVFNEEESIGKLLDSLFEQTKKADEIVIVDAASTDKTVEIIKRFKKKYGKIRFLIEKCSRAKGRNLAVQIAKNGIIAMTDAGCIAEKFWLERITKPFLHTKPAKALSRHGYGHVDIVAGFYSIQVERPLEKAFSVFLGTQESEFDDNFLPSTRSIAFRKSEWKKVGGFPEELGDTAEDSVFNYKAIKKGLKFARVKNARVEWGMPESISDFQFKIFNYAKGDAKSGIWFHPSKGFASHNIKAIHIFWRYFIGFLLSIFFLFQPLMLLVLFSFLALYFLWSFRKVYIKTKDFKAGLWGIPIQFVADFAVMAGFLSGFIKK